MDNSCGCGSTCTSACVRGCKTACGMSCEGTATDRSLTKITKVTIPHIMKLQINGSDIKLSGNGYYHK